MKLITFQNLTIVSIELWQEGDYIQWDTDFMTREQLEEYAEGI